MLIYAPDRLSRNYAYQMILMEELNNQGVEVVFINSPQSDNERTPKSEWIAIDVLAIIEGYTFDLAEEQLQKNKQLGTGNK